MARLFFALLILAAVAAAVPIQRPTLRGVQKGVAPVKPEPARLSYTHKGLVDSNVTSGEPLPPHKRWKSDVEETIDRIEKEHLKFPKPKPVVIPPPDVDKEVEAIKRRDRDKVDDMVWALRERMRRAAAEKLRKEAAAAREEARLDMEAQQLKRAKLEEDKQQLHKLRKVMAKKLRDLDEMVKLHKDKLHGGANAARTIARLTQQNEDLRQLVEKLAGRVYNMQDTPHECHNRTDCRSCIRDDLCGWCGARQDCMEGNKDGQVFGSCAGEWFHIDLTTDFGRCPADDTLEALYGERVRPKDDMIPHYIEAENYNDPECNQFKGTPGDCERAKLESGWLPQTPAQPEGSLTTKDEWMAETDTREWIIAVGDIVLGQTELEGDYMPCKVLAKNPDGTLNCWFQDGHVENQMPKEHFRPVEDEKQLEALKKGKAVPGLSDSITDAAKPKSEQKMSKLKRPTPDNMEPIDDEEDELPPINPCISLDHQACAEHPKCCWFQPDAKGVQKWVPRPEPSMQWCRTAGVDGACGPPPPPIKWLLLQLDEKTEPQPLLPTPDGMTEAEMAKYQLMIRRLHPAGLSAPKMAKFYALMAEKHSCRSMACAVETEAKLKSLLTGV